MLQMFEDQIDCERRNLVYFLPIFWICGKKLQEKSSFIIVYMLDMYGIKRACDRTKWIIQCRADADALRWTCNGMW